MAAAKSDRRGWWAFDKSIKKMRFLENGSFVSKKLQQFFNFVFFVVQHLERLDVLDCVNFFFVKEH